MNLKEDTKHQAEVSRLLYLKAQELERKEEELDNYHQVLAIAERKLDEKWQKIEKRRDFIFKRQAQLKTKYGFKHLGTKL